LGIGDNLFAASDPLIIGLGVDGTTRETIRDNGGQHAVRLDFADRSTMVHAPKGLSVTRSTPSRSATSAAVYFLEGDLPAAEGDYRIGVLAHYLPPNAHTSCHKHIPIGTCPAASELFFPLGFPGHPKGTLFTDQTAPQVISPHGTYSQGGEIHQLLAPSSGVLTLIAMAPLPGVSTDMRGHEPQEFLIPSQ